MKIFLILFLTFVGFCAFASQKKPLIVVYFEPTGNQDHSVAETGMYKSLEFALLKRIEKEFPCSKLYSKSEISSILSSMREREILNINEGRNAMDFLQDVSKADYLIPITILTVGETNYFGLRLDEPQRARTLFRKVKSCNGTSCFDELVDDLIIEMAYLEICPYLGTIEFDVHSTREKNETKKLQTFCNEQYQIQILTSTSQTDEKSNWKLTKNGYRQGTGEMSYKLYEEIANTDENPCYPCTSGRLAGRSSTYSEIKTSEGTGISSVSRDYAWSPELTDGEIFNDVRIKVQFNRDGTYLIKAFAASENIPQMVSISEKIIGSCDVQGKNEKHSFKTKIPLDCILGPFQGNPFQKTLKESGEKTELKDEKKLVYKYNFEFHRK